MTERSIFPDGVEVRQRDLANTEDTKSAQIRQTRVSVIGGGRASGLLVTVNGTTATLIDVSAGQAFTPNGELIDLQSTLAAIPLSDYTDNVDNFVYATYTEADATPAPHETDGSTRNVEVVAVPGVSVLTAAEFAAVPTTLADQTQLAQDRMTLIATVNADGTGNDLEAADITQEAAFTNLPTLNNLKLNRDGTNTVTGVIVPETSVAFGDSNAANPQFSYFGRALTINDGGIVINPGIGTPGIQVQGTFAANSIINTSPNAPMITDGEVRSETGNVRAILGDLLAPAGDVDVGVDARVGNDLFVGNDADVVADLTVGGTVVATGDITGADITGTDFIYTVPPLFSHSIPGNSIFLSDLTVGNMSSLSLADFRIGNTSLGFTAQSFGTQPSQTPQIEGFFPVNLPEGAFMTTITFWGTESNTVTPTAVLRRIDRTTGSTANITPDVVLAGLTTGIPSTGAVFVAGSQNVAQNTQYAYYVRLELDIPGSIANSLTLYTITVTYTLPEAAWG